MTVVTGAHAVNRRAYMRLNFVAWTLLLIPGAMVCGCAGVTSGNSAQASAGSQTYSISGTLSPSAGGVGAAVNLGGVARATVPTDRLGDDIFCGLTHEGYTV